MIEGRIDSNLEARIQVQVMTTGGIKEVEFLVDTGFNGFIAVPISLVREFSLPLGAVQSGVTADGRAGYFDTVTIEFLWHGSAISHRAQVLDEPLIGTRLLRGNAVSAEWIAEGRFHLSRLTHLD